MFPTLLKDTLTSLEETQAEIIKSGFRACGIYPLDKDQVLKRLPGQQSNSADESALTSALKQQLKAMRYGNQSELPVKKKRILVEPGKSIAGPSKEIESESEIEISLHDTISSVGPEDFSDLEEEETSLIIHNNDNNKEVCWDVEEAAFFLVSFPVEGKPNKDKKFVGQITKIINVRSMYECKFLHPVGMSKTIFRYPDVDDIAEIEHHQIIQPLKNPNKSEYKVHFPYEVNI